MAQESIFKMITNEEYAKVYKTFMRNSTQVGLVRNEIMNFIVNNYKNKSLDLMSIGAGAGWLEDEIIKHAELKVDNILAIEPNIEHAEKLKEKSTEWKDTQCTIDTSYFDENYKTTMKFDVILLVHSIYYTGSPINTVVALKSCLKPEGQILIVIRGERGGFELASCLHKRVRIDATACKYSWEGSVQLIEGLEKYGINYQIKSFPGLYDVTDFIERNDTPTRNDPITFLLHMNYEDLDKEMQEEIYKVAKGGVTVTKDKRHMITHTNSFIFVDNK